MREDLDVEPDAWQLEVLEAYANDDEPLLRIAMLACVGPGKTAVLAWLCLHFMFFMGHPGSHPQGAAISKTRENLRDGLWKEIAKWRQRSCIGTEMFRQSRELLYHVQYPETWKLAARGFPKTPTSEEIGAALSGLHAQYMILALDEVGSMPIEVGNVSEQALSTADMVRGVIAGAGNPISRKGLLYEMAINQASMHHVVEITGDPDDPRRSPRIKKSWAEEQIAKRGGRDHPWVQAHILGIFPAADFNALLTLDQVKEAMARNPHPDAYKPYPYIVGIDVAAEGDDRSVIFPRQGAVAHPPLVMYSGDAVEGAGHVARLNREVPGGIDAIFLDGTGGYGSAWRLALQQVGFEPRMVKFGASASSKHEFVFKKDEMYWRMRDWVIELGALPDNRELIPELVEPTYSFKGDRLTLEPKDELKKADRIGHSPDMADALALTFAEYVAPRRIAAEEALRGNQAETAWDPMRDSL